MTRSKDMCLSDEDIAVFMERRHGGAEYERIVAHMSRCDTCRTRALSASSVDTVEEGRAPAELKILAFQRARRSAGRARMVRRVAMTLAAAAVIVAGGLWALRVTVLSPDPLPGVFGFEAKPGVVDAMAVRDALLIGRLKAGTGVKSLAWTGDREIATRIREQAAADGGYARRRLASAGYCLFVLRNAGSPRPELVKQAALDCAAAGLDPAGVSPLIESGRISRLYGAVRRKSPELAGAFASGYALGEVMYADAGGTAALLKKDHLREKLGPLSLGALPAYLDSLEGPDTALSRGELRERVLRELFSR